MSELNRYTIAYKGLSVGKHSFSIELDNAFFEAFDDSQVLSGSGVVDVELDRGESMMTLLFDIRADVGVECDRCLEEVLVPIDYEDELIVRISEVEDDSDGDGDIMWLSPAEDFIDLKQYIYESVLLSLPYQRIHPEGDDGTLACNSDMLGHFKIVTEDEFEGMLSKGDTSTIGQSEMDKLLELKEKMTK